jgi:DNA-binding IclR family transcriptional regulator
MKRKQTPGRITGQIGRPRADKKGRQFITALARGLDVMRAFRSDDLPLSNQELAKRTHLPRPTVSRITYTLTEQGYLTYNEAMGCYELGAATLALGNVAKATFNVLSRARLPMQRLADQCQGNVGLGTREKLSMVYLAACQGPSVVGLRFNVGSRVPIVSTAMGRAYMAATSAEDRARIIEQLVRVEKCDRQEIMDGIETTSSQLETRGFCISIGGWHADINGVAVPISAAELDRLFVINCGAPAYMFPKQKLLNEVGPELVRTANEIKAALGSVDVAESEDVPEQGRSRQRSTAGASRN